MAIIVFEKTELGINKQSMEKSTKKHTLDRFDRVPSLFNLEIQLPVIWNPWRNTISLNTMKKQTEEADDE